MRMAFALFVCLQGSYLFSDAPTRPSSSKALTNARSAQANLDKMSKDGDLLALQLLEQLCTDSSFRRLQNDQRIWIYRMLATAFERTGAYDREQALIKELLANPSFQPYWISLKVLLAHSFLSQNNFTLASKVLKELLRTPKRRLSVSDSEEISSLHSAIIRHCEQKLHAAEKYYQQKEYTKAASLYSYIFDASLAHTYPQTLSPKSCNRFLDELCLRIASCYFLLGDYEQCVSLLISHPRRMPSGHILQGLAEKSLGHYEKAYDSFRKVAKPQDAVLWEACFCAIRAGILPQAKELLSKLADSPSSTLLEVLILISEGRYAKANDLISQTNATDYLKGYLHVHLDAPEIACEYLEEAAASSGPYQNDALILLGTTYLNLGDMKRAQNCFERLNWHSQRVLGLAKVYACQGGTDKLQTLASGEVSRDLRYEIALHIAEITNDFEPVLTHEFRNCQKYPVGLLKSRQEGNIESGVQMLLEQNRIEGDFEPLEKALLFLIEENQPEKACQLLEKIIPTIKREDLVEKSHWLYALSASSAVRLKNSKIYPNQLKNGFMPRSPREFEPGESGAEAAQPDQVERWRRAQIHGRTTPAEANSSAGLGINALRISDEFLQKYPKSKKVADVLLQKALLLWQNHRQKEALFTLSILEADYPHFSQRDVVLYFLASNESRHLYQEVYTNFPDSPYAAECYFRVFNETLYQASDVQAIAHLKKMPKSYANTPYGILATFYTASAELESLPQKSLNEAHRNALTEISASLKEACVHGKEILQSLPPKMRSYFYQRILNAQLERAQAEFSLGNFKEVRASVDRLKAESDKVHLLWQQASFLRARALFLEGNEPKAREELALLLEYARNNGCETGKAFVQALTELASLLARDGEYQTAQNLLTKALLVQANGSNEELSLEILIAKSQIHRKMGELDKAMMLLSSVINEQSASSVRLQAMYLRAELYELKGRRDLAFRQLLATSRKGGEWGIRAAKKLEDEYGYE